MPAETKIIKPVEPTTPVAVETKPVDPFAGMRERVEKHQLRVTEYVENPALGHSPFDFSRSGLPSSFAYAPVPVPVGRGNERLYTEQLRILQDYTSSGWQFLTEDFVSRDGVNGKAILHAYDVVDGRVVVAGCFIMYASKDWYNQNRQAKVDKANEKLHKTREGNIVAAEEKGFKVETSSVTIKASDDDMTVAGLLGE